jgi:hypothetical protein
MATMKKKSDPKDHIKSKSAIHTPSKQWNFSLKRYFESLHVERQFCGA